MCGPVNATPPHSRASSIFVVGSKEPSAVAPKAAAPIGRIKVWIESHRLSSHGILSARNSIAHAAPGKRENWSLCQNVETGE